MSPSYTSACQPDTSFHQNSDNAEQISTVRGKDTIAFRCAQSDLLSATSLLSSLHPLLPGLSILGYYRARCGGRSKVCCWWRLLANILPDKFTQGPSKSEWSERQICPMVRKWK